MVAEIKSLEIKENRIRTYDKIKIKVDLQSIALNHSAISLIFQNVTQLVACLFWEQKVMCSNHIILN